MRALFRVDSDFISGAKIQQIFGICKFFLQKSRIASGTIDIEKDGGKNATEGNNPHTMRDNRRNGQTKRNGLKRGGEKREDVRRKTKANG